MTDSIAPSAPLFTPLDRCCMAFQQFLGTVTGHIAGTNRPYPADHLPADAVWTQAEKACIQGCMRVNLSGEVAAQALYWGQAAGTADTQLQQQFAQAATEEADHLHWCRQRLAELEAHPSVLDPFWFIAHATLGYAVARLGGDGMNLGFLVETEEQVIAHLNNHLQQLPDRDARSRAIIGQMRRDETEHAHQAQRSGARPVPPWLQYTMRCASRLLTTCSYYA